MEIPFAKVFPVLEFNLGYHVQLKCKHDNLLCPPKVEAVGGEKGMEVNSKHCPHMIHSPLAMGLEQVAQMTRNAPLVVAVRVTEHAIGKLSI